MLIEFRDGDTHAPQYFVWILRSYTQIFTIFGVARIWNSKIVTLTFKNVRSSQPHYGRESEHSCCFAIYFSDLYPYYKLKSHQLF